MLYLTVNAGISKAENWLYCYYYNLILILLNKKIHEKAIVS